MSARGPTCRRFVANIGRFTELHRPPLPRSTTGHSGLDRRRRVVLGPAAHGCALLGETLLIAYLGTLLGAVGAFVLCFLAAANLAPQRAGCASSRAASSSSAAPCPEIVFALIFVVAFGLGPMPGVLAIAIHTAGRARQAVRRGGREHRHEAGRGRHRDRRDPGSQTMRFARPAAGRSRTSSATRCCASRSMCAAPR